MATRIIVSTLAILVLVLTACTPPELPLKPTITPTVELSGTLESWGYRSPVAGRHVVLCRSFEDPRRGDCVLARNYATTDSEGHFQFLGVPTGTYFILYDSGLSNFDEAMELWGGRTLHFGDTAWIENFLKIHFEDEGLSFRVPEGISFSPHEGWLQHYCTLTLSLGESPFIIAHDMSLARDERVLRCMIVEIVQGQPKQITIEAAYFG